MRKKQEVTESQITRRSLATLIRDELARQGKDATLEHRSDMGGHLVWVYEGRDVTPGAMADILGIVWP